MTEAAIVCPECRTGNVAGAKFCVDCGSELPSHCPSCGSATVPQQKFCAECGTGLEAGRTRVQPGELAEVPDSSGSRNSTESRDSTEIRTVSILFVDLVGYTSLSESRDAEDMREVLGRYFGAARRITDRYGGTIEKFIGDAVMAVWGTPVAREDDAERAVRAALELVDGVAALGDEVGVPDLRARAGIVTGQAALLANRDEGIVVGDRVNTAARIQAAAEPGTVLVDDVTRRASSTTIAYGDAGVHELKGKAEGVRLWRVLHRVLDVRGVDRDEPLQARFVGRDADLRLLQELFHGAADRWSARLVAVSGAAGVGKTRLRREFLEWLGGLSDGFLWHSGHCLPYGDGIAYWALAEMVRHRLGIREDAPEEEARDKLQAGLDRWIPDAAERDFLTPRLGILLGIVESGPGREELFAGWRLFFERLAAHHPVVLAFEDMHWADDGLLDFVEYLLDWSAQHRIFLLTLARPELSERRPGWPVGRRGATALYLEPLGARAMDEMVDSVATMPPEAKQRIIEHAEGIPLFAIETVRGLADRGVLTGRDGALVLAGELGELDVPPSLTALLGARLDALAPNERDLVKSMSVFGGNFPLAAAQSVAEMPAPRADAVLSNLVRKQVLRVHADPLAPERGQYAFAQALLRTVAYERLNKQERKVRHVAAAEYLAGAFANEGEDIAEIVAAHYLSAYRSAANDADADGLRAHAVAALRRGGQRAAALGAPQAAERAYRTAIDLAIDDDERVALMRAAGEMALMDGRYEAALELFDAATASLEATGRNTDAARIAPKLGSALRRVGRGAEAIDVMRRGLAVLGEREDADVAEINVELGPALLSSGAVQEAAEPIERALALAQALELPGVLAGALTFKALQCAMVGRPHESRILFEGAIDVCRRYELTDRLFFAQDNGADLLTRFDFPGAEAHAQDALATARRLGSRLYESWAASNLMRAWEYRGNWDGLEALGVELLGEPTDDRPGAEDLHLALAMLAALRGQVQGAQDHLAKAGAWRQSDNTQLRSTYAACEATIALARGEFVAAFDSLRRTVAEIAGIEGPSSQAARIGFPSAVQAALALGRLADVSDLLTDLAARPVGHVPPYLRAQLARGQGLLAAAGGDRGSAVAQLRTAVDEFRALGYPYWLSCAQVDLARMLIDDQKPTEAHPILDEATSVLKQLGAVPALERAEALLLQVRTTAGV